MTLPSKLAGLVKAEFEDTCIRRFFFGLSNDAYGGTAGLYDLGPALCSMKINVLEQWRRHFVNEESMCEIDLPCITPAEVFTASGHIERFNDIMVRDTVTGECSRLDKVIEEYAESRLADKAVKAEQVPTWKRLFNDAGSMTQAQMDASVAEFKMKSAKGNDFSPSFPFNLMFKTAIGPHGNQEGYLRPELAQGMILNFKRLMDTGNAQKLPFGAACIGQAFRNEIAPRANLIRVREFTLAEIEFFVNPNEKKFAKFEKVRDVTIWAWDRDQQKAGAEPTQRTVGALFDEKFIDNETLAYFVARAALFLERVGIKQVRFRQHRADEMAHYAQDCWDAECLTSYGWIECVGVADRSAYDLTCHIKATKKDMHGRVDYATPKIVRVLDRKVNKGACGKALGKDTGAFAAAVAAMPEDEAMQIEAALAEAGTATVTTAEGKALTITRALVAFKYIDEKQTGYTFVPSVIEPSFGVGRILYAILEQSYTVRKDDTGKNDKRAVFSFLPSIAPQKVAVFPLMMKPVLEAKANELKERLIDAGLTCRTDESGGSIGKKYARVDELGIPYAITCDFEEDEAVTLRHRDSGAQVRVPSVDVPAVIVSLCKAVGARTWDSVAEQYPKQQ